MRKCIRMRCFRLKIIALRIAMILFSFGVIYGQSENFYTITGRVIDENGKPNTDAGVLIEPAKFTAYGNERFIEEVSTDSEGRFTKEIVRNKETFGQYYLLFVTMDTNFDAVTIVEPPFDTLRKYNKAYSGRLIKLADRNLIDVGDVKAQYWYGQANLIFSEFFKENNIDLHKWDWRGFFIQVRDEKGNRADARTLSVSDIQRYVDLENSIVKISLPEGKWKIEILEDYPSPKIAESSYFEIKKGEKPKEIQIVSPRKKLRRK